MSELPKSFRIPRTELEAAKDMASLKRVLRLFFEEFQRFYDIVRTAGERTTKAGITASTTQSQGQQVLSANVNEIATCANANDVVTMRKAQAGAWQTIINNGAETLQIFPNVDDDLGSGANTSVTLAAGSAVTYRAYDGTNWVSV